MTIARVVEARFLRWNLVVVVECGGGFLGEGCSEVGLSLNRLWFEERGGERMCVARLLDARFLGSC